MSSKGKLYLKHLEQAKYVVKGKKLKSNIVMIKRKEIPRNINAYYKGYEENKKEQYLENKEQYCEVEFEIEEDNEQIEDLFQSQIFTTKNDSKDDENAKKEVELYSLKKEGEPVLEIVQKKEKELDVLKEDELTKEHVDAKIKELKQREKLALERCKKVMENEKMRERLDNLVTEEERKKGIVNERKDNISKNQLDELERLRLLELARVKKETLEKERIEKAKAKKEEKIKQEIKIKQRDEKKNVQLLQDKLDSIEKRKKARRDESKTFVIVAALLAIIIVAGMANIGGVMFKEIQKDKILVGEVEKEDDKKSSSLLDNLYNNINGLDKSDNEEKLDENTEIDENTQVDEEVNDEVGATNQQIVVVEGTENKTNNTNASNKNINSNNLIESIENIKLPVNNIEDTTQELPSNFDDNIGEQTGSVAEDGEKYVEVQYNGFDFKLYKTLKSNIKKSVVIAGACTEYTKYTHKNSVIQIPKVDAEGMWFVVKDGKIEAEFAFGNGNILGVATLVLINEMDGMENEDDIIYAKQGTNVNLGAVYYTKDDEGNKISDYAIIQNAFGKMILYKR